MFYEWLFIGVLFTVVRVFVQTSSLSNWRPVRSLDIVKTSNSPSVKYEVKTYSERFRASTVDPGTDVVVDLYSTLHIGERDYYAALDLALRNYDIVLYELITSTSNIEYTGLGTFKKKLRQAVYSPQAARIAEQLQLDDQLVLPLMRTNWFVADLEAETVSYLEKENSSKVVSMYWSSIVGGRSHKNNFLDRLFLRDATFLSMLRILAWLTPCPELNCLLIDWARMSPKAGGISPLLLPTLELFLQGKLVEARRLLFAQQLVAGLPDWGSWGGEAQSDIEVRISARNAECCRILQGFIDDSQRSIAERLANSELIDTKTPMKDYKIAVLYGAYHIQDLAERFENQLDLQRTTKMDSDIIPDFTAWSVNLPSLSVNGLNDTEASILGAISMRSMSVTENYANMLKWSRKWIFPFTCLLAYLLVGALDWWVLIKVVVQDIQPFASSSASNSSEMQDVVFSVAYFILYLQRHLFLLRSVSSVGIQWDKGLFTSLDNAGNIPQR